MPRQLSVCESCQHPIFDVDGVAGACACQEGIYHTLLARMRADVGLNRVRTASTVNANGDLYAGVNEANLRQPLSSVTSHVDRVPLGGMGDMHFPIRGQRVAHTMLDDTWRQDYLEQSPEPEPLAPLVNPIEWRGRAIPRQIFSGRNPWNAVPPQDAPSIAQLNQDREAAKVAALAQQKELQRQRESYPSAMTRLNGGFLGGLLDGLLDDCTMAGVRYGMTIQVSTEMIDEIAASAVSCGRLVVLVKDQLQAQKVTDKVRLAIEAALLGLVDPRPPAQRNRMAGGSFDFIRLTRGGWVFIWPIDDIDPDEPLGEVQDVYWPSEGGQYERVTFNLWKQLVRAGHVYRPVTVAPAPEPGPRSAWQRLDDNDF